MMALIWKEFRENLKWAVLPSLLILVPIVLFGGPGEPPVGTDLVAFHLLAAVFGAALGFVQVYSESRGDKRSLLLHRPISHSRIFLGKAIAGVGICLLALGVPLAALAAWCATPGHVAAPFPARTVLPWVVDLFTGVVYYFAGMLTAQREARWYGSRGLGLAAALLCTLLVWALPEFGHALLAIGVLGTVLGVAAWGSFLTGGAYAPQPRPTQAALAGAFLVGLMLLGVIGKYMLGEWLGTGLEYGMTLDRQGRVLIVPWQTGHGPVPPVTGLDGQVPPDLRGKRVDRTLIEQIEAPTAGVDWPLFRSYRNPGRLFVDYGNDSLSGKEVWWYAPDQGRLLGYDAKYTQFLGSFGPDGFAPAGEQPRERFQGELLYPTRLWEAFAPHYLAFPGGVYTVDFARRTIRTLLTAAPGETVLWASQWRDPRHELRLAVVRTDRSTHVVTEAGAPVLSVPLAFDRERYRLGSVGRLEDPTRFVLRYGPAWYQEPEVYEALPTNLVEYDSAGREIARRALPPGPDDGSSPARVLYGLATPLAEAATLIGTFQYLRSGVRASRGAEETVLFFLLTEWAGHFLPGIDRGAGGTRGQLPGFVAMMLVSAAVCALACFLLARRYAFARARRIGWAVCGFLFGPAGLLLMLALQEWPARIPCPACGRPRAANREHCEHCGSPHASPAPDGTEIFEDAAADLQPA
jgi:hypothetical protein